MNKNLFLALLCSGSAMYGADNKVILDLADGVTWRQVFDAGFRPKHLSDGMYMCRQYDVDLSIQFESGSSLNIGRGDVDFSLKENDLITIFSFYGRENRNLDQAKEKSELFFKIFGENVTERAEFETFQVKHEVDYSGRKIDSPKLEEHIDMKTTTNAAEIGEFAIIYGFSDSYKDGSPLVERLTVVLKSEKAKYAKRLTQEIRPPAGYEHISLDQNQDRESAERESAALGGSLDRLGMGGTRPERHPVLPTGADPAADTRSLRGLWAGLLALGVAGFAWWLGKRKTAER